MVVPHLPLLRLVSAPFQGLRNEEEAEEAEGDGEEGRAVVEEEGESEGGDEEGG